MCPRAQSQHSRLCPRLSCLTPNARGQWTRSPVNPIAANGFRRPQCPAQPFVCLLGSHHLFSIVDASKEAVWPGRTPRNCIRAHCSYEYSYGLPVYSVHIAIDGRDLQARVHLCDQRTPAATAPGSQLRPADGRQPANVPRALCFDSTVRTCGVPGSWTSAA